MSEFKPIETQEQLNEILTDRVEQAKRSASKEFKEINEQLSSKNKTYEEQIATLTAQIKEQEEKLNANDSTIKEQQAKLQSYETASVKTKIAIAAGLKMEYADRLKGETEEEWKADAAYLAKDFASARQGAPFGSNEPVITKEHSAKDDFKEWLENN